MNRLSAVSFVLALASAAACGSGGDGGNSSSGTGGGTGVRPGDTEAAGGGSVDGNGTVVANPDVPPAGTDASGKPLPAYTGTAGGPGGAYTLVGRFDASVGDTVRFSLPNSRIGIAFTGDSFGLSLTDTGVDRLAVSIDGAPAVILTTTASSTPTAYPVASGLGAGGHTAWITKMTEARQQSQVDNTQYTGSTTLVAVALAANGTLQPRPLPRPKMVVAVGDSGFTGYGIGQLQTSGSQCVYSPQTQDARLSVPAKVAEALSAEIINVSSSGKGIADSANDPNNPNGQLPSYWKMAVPPNPTPAYAFDAQPAIAVLLDAGSNDLIGPYGSGAFADTGVFVAKYTALLADMRLRYPDAHIVAIINPSAINTDKTNLVATIGQAVAARTAAGDAKVSTFDYFAADPNNWQSYADANGALNLGTGCQSHPSDAGTTFLAARLTAHVQAR